MPRIDFYIISDDTNPEPCLRLACRLTEKIWHMGHRIYLLTDTPETTERLDRLMWTFRQNSFLPHETQGNEEPNELPPILIGHEPEPPGTYTEVLINLTSRVPDFYPRFDRIAEIIDQNDENSRVSGRERFRHYRQQGDELESHNVYP